MWSQAWGADVLLAGSGGSIPIVSALAGALPNAEALLVGTTDGYANIHGPNERLLLTEFENAVAAEAALFGEYAARWSPMSDTTVPGRRRPSTRSCSGCSTASSASATRCRTRRSCSSGSASA